MTRQRMTMYGGLLAAAVAVAVTGVAARSTDGERQAMIQFDGRGSQLGLMVSDGDDAAQPGVRVDGIDADGAAQKAGVKEGDVVVEFDGERVRSARQLTRLVQETPAGRTVKMTVRRGSARQTLEVTPAAAEMTWSTRFDPGVRDDLERGLQGRRDLPRPDGPAFDFHFRGPDERRFEAVPAVPAVPGVPGIPDIRGFPGSAGRGRLGAQVESLSDQLAGYFGAGRGGVLVSSVAEDSAAAKAGLKAGDVITSVNGTTVRNAEALVGELANVKDGAEVSLGILRDKQATMLKATLEAPQPTRARRSTRAV